MSSSSSAMKLPSQSSVSGGKPGPLKRDATGALQPVNPEKAYKNLDFLGSA